MKINEILKAIKLRVVSSNINNKIYYDDAREVFFSDCYNNVMGSFIASTATEEVFEIIIKVDVYKDEQKVVGESTNNSILNDISNIIKELKSKEFSSKLEKEKSYESVSLYWVNPTYKEKRQYAFKKIKERLSTLNNLPLSEEDKNISKIIEEEKYELVDESIILEIVKKVCDGVKIIERDIVSTSVISDSAFLEISKIAYKEDVSVKQLIDKISKYGIKVNEINNFYSKKDNNKEIDSLSISNSKNTNSSCNMDYRFSIENLSNYKTKINTESDKSVSDFYIEASKESKESKITPQVEVDVEKANDSIDIIKNKAGLLRESKKLLIGEALPDCINGIFETKKGFLKSGLEKDTDEYRKISLKERINPTINKNEDLFHKHMDGKIYLSNLKVKKII